MTSAIIPMHELSAIGYQVKWNAGRCSVRTPEGRDVEVHQEEGCPMITKKEGLRLSRGLRRG